MDKKKGLINVSVSIAFKIVILVANILVRRFLIKYIGNEFNGLNSLYISILDFLSVAELGVGSAITFCMYKPIVEGDSNRVSALYGLFTKLYLIIGGIILIVGCAIMPALPYLAKDYQSIDISLYLTFGLMLISVVISYVFSSKTSLINAYKNNFITTTVSSTGQLIQCGLQIVVLICVHSFVWFLICRIIAMVLQWAATEIIVRVKHSEIINNKQKIDVDTKREVVKNIKAMFMHKIGGVLVNTADSLIISAFIGIVVLGKYSNYSTIAIALSGVMTLCFTPLTSVIGHMFVEEDKEQARKYLNFFHSFNFILGLVFFLGYYAVIDNLVSILFSDGLELSKSISFVITLNYFIQFMRQSVGLFKDATGTFYNDRWKPLFEGVLNIVLSIVFVLVFPKEYNVVGVIVATIITNLFICHIVEPHVLYKYAFGESAKNYYIRNYSYIVIFSIALVVMHLCNITNGNQWVELFANGGVSIAISLPISLMVILFNKDFRHYMKKVISRSGGRKHGTVHDKIEQTYIDEFNNDQKESMMDEKLKYYLDSIHGVLLEMMIALDGFLRANDIPYSIAYGTMLGAVRHKGFIPWDDDLDIFMKRDDYERFIKIYRENGGIDGYTLYATDNPDTWLTHTKFYKNNTAMLSSIDGLYAKETKETKHKEIFIDVFPLDKVPTNKRKRRKYMFNAKMRLVYTRDHAYQATDNRFLWLASKILLSIPRRFKRKIREKTNKYVLKYNDMVSNYDYISTADPFSIKEFIPPIIDEIIDVEFEGHIFSMYKEYDRLLRVSYGDYMLLPEPQERKPKHDRQVVILDVDKYLLEHPKKDEE